jgi:hypothetical protein
MLPVTALTIVERFAAVGQQQVQERFAELLVVRSWPGRAIGEEG